VNTHAWLHDEYAYQAVNIDHKSSWGLPISEALLRAFTYAPVYGVSRKGGTGGGGLVYTYPKGENSMAVSGFGCKIPQ